MTNITADRLLRPAEVAEIVDQKTPTIWKWCRTGELPHIRLSARNFRIRASDLEAFLNARSQ